MKSTFSAAEDLPVVYRTILDGVAVLERAGRRGEAARIRVAATRAYSTAWDGSSMRRLEKLAEECRFELRAIAGSPIRGATIAHRARRVRWPVGGIG
jgi:hypothetical protein